MVREELKEELNIVIKKYGLQSQEAYHIGMQLSYGLKNDRLKKTIQSYYEVSLEELVQYIKNNTNNPSESKWNEYAIKNNYLSAKTIGYLYGKGFNNLCRTLRKKINNKNKIENRE